MPAIGWITPGLMTIAGVLAGADLVAADPAGAAAAITPTSERGGAHRQPGNFPLAHVSLQVGYEIDTSTIE